MALLRPIVKRSLFVPFKKRVSNFEIQRYLNQNPAPKLNVGAGRSRVPGWLSVDISPPPGITFMDAGARWPFADGSLHAILCEHMIEHVPKALGITLLNEMRRTLKPGGWVRVVTPDLNWFAKRLLDPSASTAEQGYLEFINSIVDREITTWCDAMNVCFYEYGHRYIWTIEELQAQMIKSGFSELTLTRAAYPKQKLFDGVESHPRFAGHENDALEAFAIEASVGS